MKNPSPTGPFLLTETAVFSIINSVCKLEVILKEETP